MTRAFEPGRTLPAKSLELFFDYTCPFAYLASTQGETLARAMGVPLTWSPMLLGGVFAARGQPQNLAATLAPAKAAHNLEDMQRWARRFAVPLVMPAGHPRRSVDALRATLATEIDPAVIRGFFEAYWVRGEDIALEDVRARVLRAAGHDAEAVLARAKTDAIKDDLRARTDRAVSLGIFGAPAWLVDGTSLYWGQDRMTFAQGERPPARAPATPSRAHTLDVYWDFSSPFAYLGTCEAESVAARTGATLSWKPLLLGGLFRGIGTPDVPLATFSEAKQRYTMKDLERWAAYWGVPFRFPSRFPMRTVLALRTWLALPAERRDAFRAATFRAAWAEDADIEDAAVLARCAGDDDVARAAVQRARDDDALKSELKARTAAAAEAGVFGVPTFVVDGAELFWGQDRLELVEDALGD